jgi:hypothetical protein
LSNDYDPKKKNNNKAYWQGCRARLPGKAARQGFLARLPGKAGGQGCRARLPGKAAGQGCWARLPGKAAGQGCRARLPGRAAGQDGRAKVHALVQYAESMVKLDNNAMTMTPRRTTTKRTRRRVRTNAGKNSRQLL